MSNLIPDNFIPFLQVLSLKPFTQNEKPLVELCPTDRAMMPSGNWFKKHAIAIYQRESTTVTLSGFRQKLLKCLHEGNHVATSAVVDAILGCAISVAHSGADRATFLEEVLSQMRIAEVSHFFIIPAPAIKETLSIDGYRLGKIDLPLLTSRCNRAGSNYAKHYAMEHEGKFTLQSPVFSHTVIDFLKSIANRGLTANTSVLLLLLNYFEQVSRLHFQFMWSHLERTQVLSNPFGFNILDVHQMRSVAGQFAGAVTIYLDFSRSKSGYVVPVQNGVDIGQQGPESDSYARFIEHRKNYRLGEVGESELGRALYAGAGFCQQANRFLESGRADDAALYAMICLEQLFSEKGSAVESVCTRTAVLTHLRQSSSYSEAEKELRKLYEARSAFVHSGKSVTPTQAERLISYARETLRAMLVLHLNPDNRQPGFLDKWVKKLDFIVPGIGAGITSEAAFLAECGIFRL